MYPKSLLAATVVLNILEKSFRLEVVILSEYDIQGRSFVYFLKLFCIIQDRAKQAKSWGIQQCVLSAPVGEKFFVTTVTTTSICLVTSVYHKCGTIRIKVLRSPVAFPRLVVSLFLFSSSFLWGGEECATGGAYLPGEVKPQHQGIKMIEN